MKQWLGFTEKIAVNNVDRKHIYGYNIESLTHTLFGTVERKEMINSHEDYQEVLQSICDKHNIVRSTLRRCDLTKLN